MIKKLKKFFNELRRRHVFKVAAAYGVISWVTAEVTNLLTTAYHSPDWIMQAYIAFVILFFPIVLVTAWAYDLKPEDAQQETVVKTEPKKLPAKANNRSSILVLPLNNFGSSDKDDYIADGMTEDLITLLSRTPGLFVIARNTSYYYKDKKTPIPEIAAELGVNYLVEGSVRPMGKHMRVNIQLIDAATQTHIWAQLFDFDEENLFDVKHDISVRISTQLAGSVTVAESDRAKLLPSNELDSWLLTQRAIQEYFSRTSSDNFKVAIDLLKQALALDPEYPYALAFHAHLCTTGLLQGYIDDKEATVKIINQEIQQALKLAPKDPMVLWCWGVVQGFLGNKAGAITTLAKAMEGNPNDPHIRADLGMFLIHVGRAEEGIKLLHYALQLSPHEPRVYVWHFYLGSGLAHTDLQASLLEIQKSIDLSNEYIPALAAKIVALALLQRADEAKAAAETLFRIHPNLRIKQLIRMFEMSIGQPEVLARYLAVLKQYCPGDCE